MKGRGSASGRASDLETRKTVEAEPVGGDDGSSGRQCGRGDDEVVCPSGATGGSDGDEQFRVRVSDPDVVSDDRQIADDVVEEFAAGSLPLAGGDPDPDAQFRDRDGSDRGLVVVSDQCVEVERCSLRFDQDVGVQEE